MATAEDSMTAEVDGETHRYRRVPGRQRPPAGDALRNKILTALLFGSMGAITWAIRGTAGWDGVDGTIVPGLTWGLIWWHLCHRRGIDARGVVLWLGLGIAIGGELGYGQYVSWIRGIIELPDGAARIAPWHGFVWLVICGIGWAAPGGIALGWALSKRSSPVDWVIRLILFAALIALACWPVVNMVAGFYTRLCPSLFYPYYESGIYEGVLHAHQERTVYTNSQNASFVLWWVVALLIAALRKDRATLILGSLVGGGFGLGFAQSALWCLGYTCASGYVDWWKVWELNAGFNLGLLYTVAYYWAVRQVDEPLDSSSAARVPANASVTQAAQAEQWRSAGSLLFVSAILLFAFFEGFLSTGVLLASFYAISLCAASLRAEKDYAAECRARVSLSFGVFLLIFILLRGATCNLGVLLGLYDAALTDQYAWPAPRIVLFAPMAVLTGGAACVHMWRNLTPREHACAASPGSSRITVLMADLITGLGAIGAATIWPEKIGVLYAVCVFSAVFALSRLNVLPDERDPSTPV